ncbi:MAG: HD domain-containing protein [Pirellulales bacterium]|nr:HD domain-containing protein [Pirellulales bacterium]
MSAVQRAVPLVALADLVAGQEADCFALLSRREELQTKDGKPYFRVTFRDARREIAFPIWSDSAWAIACRDTWTVGGCYKLRVVLRETNFGPQLEIRKIREAGPDDAADGFDPAMFLPRSRFDSVQMFDELAGLARDRIAEPELRQLVLDVLEQNREQLLRWPAARRNHHAFAGGFLEHVLNVTRHATWLAEQYDRLYPDLEPRLNVGLVTAGAIVHDLGKLRELELLPDGTQYTAAGNLIGHILQGRDMLREAAAGRAIDPELLLRLEHVIVAHQRLPEWGSPKPPMTPEAMIVHYADDLDAKYQMLYRALADESGTGPITSSRNPMNQPFYRGG